MCVSHRHVLELDWLDNWSRPIFNLDSNFKQLTKEERLRRDIEHVKTQKRRSSDENKQDRGDDMDEMLNSTDRLLLVSRFCSLFFVRS